MKLRIRSITVTEAARAVLARAPARAAHQGDHPGPGLHLPVLEGRAMPFWPLGSFSAGEVAAAEVYDLKTPQARSLMFQWPSLDDDSPCGRYMSSQVSRPIGSLGRVPPRQRQCPPPTAVVVLWLKR